MSNGSYCGGKKEIRAETAIRFVCDESAFSTGLPSVVVRLPVGVVDTCAHFVEWRTPVSYRLELGEVWALTGGCFGSWRVRRRNLGVLLDWLEFSFQCEFYLECLFIYLYILMRAGRLLVALLAYIFGAILYNRYALGRTGFDQLPTFPSFILNGVEMVQDKLDDYRSRRRYAATRWNNGGGGGGGGYGRVDDEERERFSFEREMERDQEDAGEGGGRIVYNDFERQKVVPPPPPPKDPSELPAGMDSNGVIRL